MIKKKMNKCKNSNRYFNYSENTHAICNHESVMKHKLKMGTCIFTVNIIKIKTTLHAQQKHLHTNNIIHKKKITYISLFKAETQVETPSKSIVTSPKNLH